ncbi:MAG TPA: TetR/AcrR family transcriptional regulator [Gemmatimonadaceae bacterium]|nr:TetR/AcrR family transcriptional regulator [Gemmatimonadaceae bacterium]
MTVPSLRERQASLARTAIFEALVGHLEAGDADDVPMEDLARDAGVSRRTLYRYFPTRAALLAEAAEWIRDEVLQLPVEIGREGIVASFRQAAERVADRPELARALLRTSTGRTLRGGYRSARVAAIRDALRREVPGLSRRELDRAAPVLTYLCSSSAWISIQDESGLAPRQAQAAVEWAIDALLAQLRDSTPTLQTGGRT